MNNEEKEIKWEYSTRPIGKVVKQKTYPTGMEFTIDIDLKDKSDEEISNLIAYINKNGIFVSNLSTRSFKRGVRRVDIKYVDIMCERINTQTKALELSHNGKMKEDLERLFWDIQILLRTMENEIEDRRKKAERGE